MGEERNQPLGLWRTIVMVCTAGRPGRIFVAPVLVLLMCSVVVLASTFALYPPDTLTPREQLAYAGQLMLFACLATAFFASGRARALAFVRILPAVHTPRALILLPAFVVGLAVAIVASLFVPPLSALALLGWWCWAASVGLRFAFGSGWLLLLLGTPLVFLGPLVAAAIAAPFAGPNAPALSAPVLGLVGYLASHRDLSRDLISRTPRPHRRSSATAFVNTHVERASRQGRFSTLLGLIDLVAPRWLRVLTVFLLALSAVMVWVNPLHGATFLWIVGLTASTRLAEANQPARVEFLSTRPLSPAHLRGALVVFWALIALFLPTISLVRVTVATTIPRSDLRRLPYPEAAITAAAGFPPASDPVGADASPSSEGRRALRGNTEVPVTPALRVMMIRHLGYLTLIQCAAFCTLGAFAVAGARKSGKWRRAVYVLAFVPLTMVMFVNSADATKGMPLPPLWVVALLTGLGVWELRRSLRLPLRA